MGYDKGHKEFHGVDMKEGFHTVPGYPWGFWAGPGYDLIAEGKERFVKKTKKIRDHARKLGIKLCHEIHPGTGAMCAEAPTR